MLARKQRVLIEGVRMIKRHLKKSQDNPQGKIAEREGPIHISNVKVLERSERDGKGKGKQRQSGQAESAERRKRRRKRRPPRKRRKP